MIQCPQCKVMNSPTENFCKQCGSDLLPGVGRSNRIVTVILGVFLFLLIGVPAFLTMRYASTAGGVTEEVICIIVFLFLIAGLLFLWALYMAFRKTPEGQRYMLRGTRHLKVDPEQAFSDYTKAVTLSPGNGLRWKARNALYEKLELKPRDFQREIQFLSTALESARGALRNELSQQIVLLYEKLIRLEEFAGVAVEANKNRWKQLNFMEAHVIDLLQFKTDKIGWGTGITLVNRDIFRAQIQQEYIALCHGGVIKVAAYCYDCQQVIAPVPQLSPSGNYALCCPNDNRHKKIRDVKFLTHEEFDGFWEEMQQKYVK